MKKTFSLYCDESTHLEHDGKPYMLISYVGVANNEVKRHSHYIKELKIKHKFMGEMKWTGVSHSQYQFYAEAIDYFFTSDLYFRSVIVDKHRIDKNRHDFTYDDFYYRMYYQLLHHKMSMEYLYDVYLDIKDTRGAKKVKKMREILNIKYDRIRNIQLIHSYESNLMQLCDLLMGALNYHLRNESKVDAKTEIIKKISQHIKHPLHRSTSKSDDKFNLFFIELK